MPTNPAHVDFWFDPGCPFTWRTSRWLAGVAGRRGLQVRWHLMSLAILNEGEEVPPQHRDRMARGQVATRFLQAVRDAHGDQALGRAYAEVGRLVHEQDADLDTGTYRQALATAGLPTELATAGEDERHQAAVAASHRQGQERVGEEAGSPIIAVGAGPGFFGPIVVPAPSGDDAERLFDALVLLSGIPAFSELKRARQSL